MPTPETNRFIRSARVGIVIATIAGGALVVDGFRKTTVENDPTGPIELTSGAVLMGAAVYGGEPLIERQIIALAEKRREEVLANPSAYPLHVVDMFLEEEEDKRLKDIVRSGAKSQVISEENGRFNRIKESRKILRNFQTGIKEEFEIDKTSKTVVRTNRSERFLFIRVTGETQVILMSTFVKQDPLEIMYKVVQDKEVVKEFVPGRTSDGQVIFDGPNFPTNWEGISATFYAPRSTSDQWYCVLTFDSSILSSIIKEKELPLLLKKRY